MPHRCRSSIKNDNQGASNTDCMRENDANWSEGCTALAAEGCALQASPVCFVPCAVFRVLHPKAEQAKWTRGAYDLQASSKEIKIFGTNVRGMPKAKSETSAAAAP